MSDRNTKIRGSQIRDLTITVADLAESIGISLGKADSAVQPGANISVLVNDADYTTLGIVKADVDIADALSKKHAAGAEHTNLALLETYTQTNDDLNEAVLLRHSRNTDQYLDFGGANQVAANQIITKPLAHVFYWINCDTGDDLNSGTELAPFKTIQRAINLAPKHLLAFGGSVIIRLQSSLNYVENVNIDSFVGGAIFITSVTGNPDDVLVTGQFTVTGCSSRVHIDNISHKVVTNNGMAVRNSNSNISMWRPKFGTDGIAINTRGIVAERFAIQACFSNMSMDIDANKVAIGVFVQHQAICTLNSAEPFGVIHLENPSGFVYMDGGLIIKMHEYNDAIFKRHDVSFLGTKQIDEANIGDGRAIRYVEASGKLEYYTPTDTGFPKTDIIINEIPSGLINGVNAIFTLVNTPEAGSVQVFLNGLLQQPGSGRDYTISGATITFAIAPVSDDIVLVNYIRVS